MGAKKRAKALVSNRHFVAGFLTFLAVLFVFFGPFVAPGIFGNQFEDYAPLSGAVGSVILSGALLWAYMGTLDVQETQTELQRAGYRPFFRMEEFGVDEEEDEVSVVIENIGRGRAEGLSIWIDIFLEDKHIGDCALLTPSGGNKTERLVPKMKRLQRTEDSSNLPENNWLEVGDMETFSAPVRFEDRYSSPQREDEELPFSELWSRIAATRNSKKAMAFEYARLRFSLVYYDELGERHVKSLREGEPWVFDLERELNIEEVVEHTNNKRTFTDEQVENYIDHYRKTPSEDERMRQERVSFQKQIDEKRAMKNNARRHFAEVQRYVEENPDASPEEIVENTSVNDLVMADVLKEEAEKGELEFTEFDV